MESLTQPPLPNHEPPTEFRVAGHEATQRLFAEIDTKKGRVTELIATRDNGWIVKVRWNEKLPHRS